MRGENRQIALNRKSSENKFKYVVNLIFNMMGLQFMTHLDVVFSCLVSKCQLSI